MRAVLVALVVALVSVFRSRASLHLEVLALRHQLAVLQGGGRRPRLNPGDRLLWVWLSRAWSGWQDTLVFVKPSTVISWQRKRFRDHWTRLTRMGTPGRPPIAQEIRDLIRRMSESNPSWGSPRIRSELRKLGIDVAKATVEKYRVRQRKPPSPASRAFLANHVNELVSLDFFTVPTVRFNVLFVLIILAHDRRRVVHFHITEHPTARWTAQQVVEAFPWDTAPRFLLRDRDGIYGADFRRRVKSMGIEEVIIAARSPWRRVGCWRGTRRRRLSVAPRFRWECLTIGAMGPFPAPAHRTVRADFPHTALVQALMTSPWAGLHVALAA